MVRKSQANRLARPENWPRVATGRSSPSIACLCRGPREFIRLGEVRRGFSWVPGCPGCVGNFPRCPCAQVLGCPGAQVPGCLGARVPGCLIAL
eukprot:8224984-Pyramimonas_sp.AAC.1